MKQEVLIMKCERAVGPVFWEFRVRDFGVSKEKELCAYVISES
jgi:hypothetical protein